VMKKNKFKLTKESEQVGTRLRKWRKDSNITLDSLSATIGVSQGSLSDIENGNSLPSFKTLCRYRFCFPQVDWEDIFFW